MCIIYLYINVGVCVYVCVCINGSELVIQTRRVISNVRLMIHFYHFAMTIDPPFPPSTTTIRFADIFLFFYRYYCELIFFTTLAAIIPMLQKTAVGVLLQLWSAS